MLARCVLFQASQVLEIASANQRPNVQKID